MQGYYRELASVRRQSQSRKRDIESASARSLEHAGQVRDKVVAWYKQVQEDLAFQERAQLAMWDEATRSIEEAEQGLMRGIETCDAMMLRGVHRSARSLPESRRRNRELRSVQDTYRHARKVARETALLTKAPLLCLAATFDVSWTGRLPETPANVLARVVNVEELRDLRQLRGDPPLDCAPRLSDTVKPLAAGRVVSIRCR